MFQVMSRFGATRDVDLPQMVDRLYDNWPWAPGARRAKALPSEVGREACERMFAGEAIKDLADDLGIAIETLCRSRRQALIGNVEHSILTDGSEESIESLGGTY
jgi:hypothetical protein